MLEAFEQFPEEARLIGRLLAGYADLELSLMHCVKAIRNDLDGPLKALFRARGETSRLLIADGLGRANADTFDLANEFAMTIAGMRHCLRIRNQFAHCVWHNDLSGRLAFVNLEELAAANQRVDDLIGLGIAYVSVELLAAQWTYFQHVDRMLLWVTQEACRRAERPALPPRPWPGQTVLPDLRLV
jgi:hypothetical protein